MRLLKKPNSPLTDQLAVNSHATLNPEEYLATVYEKIFNKTQELEELTETYESKKLLLTEEFERLENQFKRDIGALESVLIFKRQERAQLESPLTERYKAIGELERIVFKRETEVLDKEQNVFERERETERKLESVQELADTLGEAKIRIKVKEELLNGLEESLKDKEMQYMLKVERFSHEVNTAAAHIQERENEVYVKELNIKGKEENLSQREVTLSNGNQRLADRREVLARAWKELNDKKYG